MLAIGFPTEAFSAFARLADFNLRQNTATFEWQMPLSSSGS
jgi:hypothetical protein